MKYTVKAFALIVTLALVVTCMIGCGKKNSANPGGGLSAEPQNDGTTETTLPITAGVEEWDNTDQIQRPNQRPDNQETNNQQTGNQTGNQQSGNTDVSGNTVLTIEQYEALPTAKQQEYFLSFKKADGTQDVEAFYAWLDNAEANRIKDETVTGDGSLNLGDYVNKNP